MLLTQVAIGLTTPRLSCRTLISSIDPIRNATATEAGDRDVVIDLPDRLHERPVVGDAHEQPVEGVEQAHPAREQEREDHDRVPRQPAGRSGTGENEERDLGRGVEPKPE